MDTGIIYSRVSTKDQRDNSESLSVQIEHAQQLAYKFGINIAYEPLEEDASGYTIDRLELNKLRALIRQRKIKSIIINESSRLSREVKHGEELLDEMYEHGVKLYIYYPHMREVDLHPDSMDREMLLQEMIFNRKWGKMLKRQMDWGKEGKLSRGKWVGYAVPYGYLKVGKRDDTHLIIDEDRARNVRDILTWYVNGDSLAVIIKKLHGIASPGEEKKLFKGRNDGTWPVSTIYFILNNARMYAGTYIQTYKGKEYPIDIPAIVSADLAEKVIAKLEVGRAYSRRGKVHDYMLTNGRAACGCGYKIIGESQQQDGKLYQYYSCSSKAGDKARGKCGFKKIRTYLVEEIIWEYAKAMLKNPRALVKTFYEQRTIIEQQNKDIYARIAQLDKTIAKHTKKLEQAVNASYQTASKRVSDMIQAEINRIDSLLNELEEEKRDLAQKIQDTGYSDEVLRAIESYSNQVRNEVDVFDYKRRKDAIEILGITATIEYKGGDHTLWIHFCMRHDRFVIGKDDLSLESICSSTLVDTTHTPICVSYRITVRCGKVIDCEGITLG